MSEENILFGWMRVEKVLPRKDQEVFIGSLFSDEIQKAVYQGRNSWLVLREDLEFTWHMEETKFYLITHWVEQPLSPMKLKQMGLFI